MKWWDALIDGVKDVFRACRSGAWFLLPISAVCGFFKYIFVTWLPARAKDLIAFLLAHIPTTNITPASVGIAWDKINLWVPINEITNYAAILFIFWGSCAIVKLVKKMLPLG